ncbi:MAG: hypothetical protein WA581_17360 [Candidatus Acidiferrales bacterium]
MARRCMGSITIGLCFAAGPAGATDLEPKTLAAFERYVAVAEAQIDEQLSEGQPYLWVEGLPASRRAMAEAQLRAGQVVIERLDVTGKSDAEKPISVPGGMIHHWIGTVFIPGATLEQTLSLEEDYDHQQEYFQPDVMRSRILHHDGNDFTIELRLYKKKVIATVLDTEHQVHYTLVDATHAWSRSRTIRIQEVENAGEPSEHLEPEGHDRGLLWRMNTYWRFEEKDGGTYVECQSISLTRDIPTGLGWLIGPYVNSVPRESLNFTLETTRARVLQRIATQPRGKSGS